MSGGDASVPPPVPSLAEIREDGAPQDAFAVLRQIRAGRTKNGDPYLDLRLADTSGVIAAKVWSSARGFAAACELRRNTAVKVRFHVEEFQGNRQLRVIQIRAASDGDACDTARLFGPGHAAVADLLCDNLVFDIETVPRVERRALPATVAETLTKHIERHDSDEAKVMGMSPFFGKVVALAVGDGDADPAEQRVTVLAVPPAGCDPTSLPDWVRPMDEVGLLHAWWCLAAAAETVIGYNSKGFDVPFLVSRSLVHGIPASVDLAHPYSLRPHLDLYRAITAGRALGPSSLDVVCWALGIESPKGQMDGSMVAPAYQRGEIERIATYNAHDVRATTAVFQAVRETVLRFRDGW